ncbi:MAG: hypothetical protein MI742_07370 [Desulfobacterales bacterium]|nr:hypothetical protein [Desulfobacterales bacterium]
MKWINKLKGFLPAEYAAWIPVCLVALLLFGGLVLFLKKRKKSEKEAAPEPKAVKELPSMAPHSLVKAWKGFLSQIPGEFRRIIMVYQHFVVFGESGAGKSVLINNHTDWQGHARQFYPSYTANPLLQVYLGSKVLVQEIPSSILNDTSKAARVALLKLWKPLFRRKDPTAVVVLNCATFQTDEPLFLKKEAQMLRGKINLLARARKKPIKVRLVLTNMELCEGFPEFSKFLNDNHIPLKLEFGSKEDLARLESCLLPYEEHLSRALISLEASDYLKIMTFLEKAPVLLGELGKFISVLQSPDPLTPEPEVTSLSLAFLSDEYTPVSNPFDTSLTTQEIKKFNPLLKHRIAAGALGALGVIYLAGSFIYERHLIQERYVQIEKIEKAPLSQYNQNMHKLFVDPLTSIKQRTLLDFIPDFFPQANREIYRRGVANIRNYYLIPELEKYLVSAKSWDVDLLDASEQSDSRNRVLYLLGLLYATQGNDLGELIMENMDAWADNTGLSRLLIEDYVHFNESSDGITIDMNDYIYTSKKGVIDDPLAIMVFFEKVKKYYYQPVLSLGEFETLRQEAEGFLGRILDVERYDLSVKVTELLRREAMLSINTQEINTADFKTQVQQTAIKEFLRFLLASRISRPDVTGGMNLSGLYENLKVMMAYKGLDTDSDSSFQFVLAGRNFKFNAARWNDLLNRSRMSLFINDFIDHNIHQDGTLFFHQREDFSDLLMNASNNGMFLFRGQYRVDGRFTRKAFEKRVQPVVSELPPFIEGLPVPEKDKARFSRFLMSEVDAYGQRYAEAYQNYYMDFDIGATSLATLRLVLKQLNEPTSPLMDVLMAVKENTLIPIGENIYLHTFAKHLETFSFLGRLLTEQKGAFPEMETYKAFLEQMLLEIDAHSENSAHLGKFEKRLSSLARISYAMFLGREGSYLSLMEQWVESVGIPYQWRGAFMAPVLSAYAIGKPEVEQQVALIWNELYERDIQPLHDFFPFNRTTGRDVSLAMLGRSTHPNGHFWEVFKGILGAITHEDAGVWSLRPTSLETLEVPEKMLPTLNAVQRLTATLWNDEGDVKPLTYMVKPYPLPQVKAGGPLVSLAYLHAGDFSIFGFNQQPAWKKMDFDWSRENSASVGVELLPRKGGPSKLYNAVEVGRSAWSFYHLLQRSENASAKDALGGLSKAEDEKASLGDERRGAEPTIFTWVVNYRGERGRSVTDSGLVDRRGIRGLQVSFAIRNEDPWSLFRLPK